GSPVESHASRREPGWQHPQADQPGESYRPLGLSLGRARRWRKDGMCLLSARTHGIAPMRDLRPGVWHWQSPHPDWNEEQWWPELVSSYAIELGDAFLLFDPLSVPDEVRDRATAV